MAKKDFGKRLIPEYLLKYSEDLHKNHPDPSASWGGGSEGGGDYTAGYGIKINDKDISIDQNVVASKSDIVTSYNDLTDKPTIPTKTSDLQNDSGFINGVAWDDVKNKPTFATVATSGSYNDLTDKPYIIPSSKVVTTTEVQTISGVKTFEDNIKIKEVTGAQTTAILPDTFDYTQINPATREKSRTKFKLPTSKPKGTEDAPTEYTLATTDDIPNVPSTDNLVTLDTAQTITGLKTIGQTSGTLSEVDFSGFTFKLVNKAINSTEAEIKISNASYDGNQHPHIYSTKGLYVNLAKIRLGDDGSNTYGIKMPDSSTWESDRILATTADIPTVPTTATSTSTSTVTPTTETLVFTLADNSTVSVTVMTGATVDTTTTTTLS